MKEIIAVTNDKGGVGKTTTAQNMATALMLKGQRVLIIDADPQQNDSVCNGWLPQREQAGERTLYDALETASPLPIYKSERGLYFTPSSPKMTNIEPFLQKNLSPNTVLRSIFQKEVDDHTGEGLTLIDKDFDYAIIDCPPSLGSITINAMAAATGLIIPVQLEGFAVRGLGKVTAKFKEVHDALNPNLSIRGFLYVMVDPRLTITKAYSKALDTAFPGVSFKTVIHRNVRISESQDSSADIFAYDDSCVGAKDYMAFVEEFLATSPNK